MNDSPSDTPKHTLSILLLDDNGELLELIAACLRIQAGFAVDLASTVEVAIRKLQQNHYDLLATDVHLSRGQSGLDLVERIRAGEIDERLKTLPILAYSGIDHSQMAHDCGANRFVGIPISPTELLEAIVGILRQMPAEKEKGSYHR